MQAKKQILYVLYLFLLKERQLKTTNQNPFLLQNIPAFTVYIDIDVYELGEDNISLYNPCIPKNTETYMYTYTK